MTRKVVSVLVVVSLLAVISPALVAGHGSARSNSAPIAMPSWAASLASKMFAPLTQPRRVRQAPSVTVPPRQLQGTTCYVAGGSVCPFKALEPKVIRIRTF